MDLGSAHGSKVNKKSVLANEYVHLFVGDVVAFGASSRMYIVNGPSRFERAEYDSRNLQLYRQELAGRSARLAKRQAEEESSGIDWGFREDAVNEDEDEGGEVEDRSGLPDYIKNDQNYDRKYGKKYSSSLDDSEVHEKDKELLEKVRTKERKIQNMQEENRRIYMKENSQESGLTEGQAAAVARNDTRIETLVAEIEEIQHNIASKSLQRMARAEGSDARRGQGGRGRDEDSELYDTTDATADAATNWRLKKKLVKKMSSETNRRNGAVENVVTYESLLKQKGSESSALADIMQSIKEQQQRLQDSAASATSTKTDDSLDGYLKASLYDDVGQSMRKLKAQEQEQLRKLADIEKLLKIATPAIKSLIPKAPTASGATAISSSDSIATHRSTDSVSVAAEDDMLVPSCESTVNVAQGREEVTSLDTVAYVPEMESSVENFDCKNNLDDAALKRKQPPTDGITSDHPDKSDSSVNAVTRSGSQNSELPPKKRIATASRGPSKAAENNFQYNDSILEGGDSSWVPPGNQSGDGRSSLNDKFGY